MREIIETSFNLELDNIFNKNTTALEFVKNHERKKVCIDNLLKEIKKAELSHAVNMTREKIQGISKDFARSFAKATLNFEERRQMTALQKDLEQKKHSEIQEIDALLNEEVEILDRSESL